jgi:hypothetical protein
VLARLGGRGGEGGVAVTDCLCRVVCAGFVEVGLFTRWGWGGVGGVGGVGGIEGGAVVDFGVGGWM